MNSVVDLVRRASLALLALAPLACNGSITFGSDRAEAGVAAGPDTGVVATPDAGTAVDSGPPADAGCRARITPPFPTMWPYARTKAADQLHFWSTLPGRDP